MNDDQPIPLPTDIATAQRALERRALVISGNRYQPKIIWTLQPWSAEALREQIEAGGASPFRVTNHPILLGRQAILWAGAPHWAQYAYLVMVELKAVNVG